MSVVVEREEWVLSCLIYGFLFACCFFSVFLLPYFSQSGGVTRVTTTASSLFDVGPTTPILRFQKSFLLLFSLASVMEGLESIYGEYDFTYHGMSREQMVLVISAGVAVSVVLGTFVGILSDIIGPRNLCVLFSLFHLLVGVLKRVNWHPSMLLSSLCIGSASTVYSFCFETWMVTEHEKQGHRMDVLSDTFWLMTLFESASMLVCQGLANLFIKDHQKGFLLRSALAALLAIISIRYIRKEWNGNRQKATIENYQKSFTGHILAGTFKKIWIAMRMDWMSLDSSSRGGWRCWGPFVWTGQQLKRLGKVETMPRNLQKDLDSNAYGLEVVGQQQQRRPCGN